MHQLFVNVLSPIPTSIKSQRENSSFKKMVNDPRSRTQSQRYQNDSPIHQLRGLIDNDLFLVMSPSHLSQAWNVKPKLCVEKEIQKLSNVNLDQPPNPSPKNISQIMKNQHKKLIVDLSKHQCFRAAQKQTTLPQKDQKMNKKKENIPPEAQTQQVWFSGTYSQKNIQLSKQSTKKMKIIREIQQLDLQIKEMMIDKKHIKSPGKTQYTKF